MLTCILSPTHALVNQCHFALPPGFSARVVSRETWLEKEGSWLCPWAERACLPSPATSAGASARSSIALIAVRCLPVPPSWGQHCPAPLQSFPLSSPLRCLLR